MEGTPPMSSYEDETGVKLIIIIIIVHSHAILSFPQLFSNKFCVCYLNKIIGMK